MDFFLKKDVDGLKANELCAELKKCAEDLKRSYFSLGGLVGRVKEEGLWTQWEGKKYKEFEDWCWVVLGFRERKAESISRIFDVVSGLHVDSARKKKLVSLGWSKLDRLARVLDDDNADEWIEKAETLGARTLAAEVRIALGEDEKGSKDLDGSEAAAEKDLPKMTLTFDTKDDYRHVVKAMEVVEKRTKIGNNGKIIGLMATAYLASHVRDDEGGMVVELEYLIEAIEHGYGVKLHVEPLKKMKKATAHA